MSCSIGGNLDAHFSSRMQKFYILNFTLKFQTGGKWNACASVSDIIRAQRYLLDDVEQAAEVMRAAALGEVHQQLRGLFPDGQISIFSDLTQLRNHHHLDQLLLIPENTDDQEKPQPPHQHKQRHDWFRTDFIELSICAEHEG